MIPTNAAKEKIRALTQKMQTAFAEERHGLFRQLVNERFQLLKSLDQGPALSDEFRKLLQEITTHDQTWLDSARHKRDMLRVEIDRLRGRRSALQQLSKAYNKKPPYAQFFSRRG
jgi:hypothetical protein